MKKFKKQDRFDDLGHAIEQLGKAVALPKDYFLRREGMIQCFEYTIELYWKVIKDFLDEIDVPVPNPRDVFVEANRLKWLPGGDLNWIDMLKDRNRTSHDYHEEQAEIVIERIEKRYYPAMIQTYAFLKTLVED